MLSVGNLKKRVMREKEVMITKSKGGGRVKVVLPEKGGKTPLMLLLEHRYGKDIRELIGLDKSQREIGRLLHINNTTVHYWRKKLGMDGA